MSNGIAAVLVDPLPLIVLVIGRSGQRMHHGCISMYFDLFISDILLDRVETSCWRHSSDKKTALSYF